MNYKEIVFDVDLISKNHDVMVSQLQLIKNDIY